MIERTESVALTSNEQDINTALAWLEGPWQAAENRRGAANAAAVIRALRDAHETNSCAKFRIGDDVVVTRWHAPAKVKGFIYELEDPFQYPERERDLSPPAQKANSCVCGEPNSPGTHRTDGPCLAPIGDHHP